LKTKMIARFISQYQLLWRALPRFHHIPSWWIQNHISYERKTSPPHRDNYFEHKMRNFLGMWSLTCQVALNWKNHCWSAL
jgi:hypothetical protein